MELTLAHIQIILLISLTIAVSFLAFIQYKKINLDQKKNEKKEKKRTNEKQERNYDDNVKLNSYLYNELELAKCVSGKFIQRNGGQIILNDKDSSEYLNGYTMARYLIKINNEDA